ncbi:hypothetical protein KA005_04800, partial [bacterium]|nr:hypothetical protein [bacterium]
FIALFSVRILQYIGSGASGCYIYWGAAISLVLFLLSDVFSYMSGNLISEVLVIFFIGLSLLLITESWIRSSVFLALLGGGAAFLLYVVRMESIWNYASFIVAAGWLAFSTKAKRAEILRSLVVSGLVALVLFGLYSWYFFPLTDPILFVRWQSLLELTFTKPENREWPQIFAAGGLLWIGVFLVLGSAQNRTTLIFTLLLFGVCMFPFGIALTSGYTTQVRMYTPLIPSLFLFSTLGWSQIVKKAMLRQLRVPIFFALGSIVGFLIFVSNSYTYEVVRSLPGVWRVMYLREFLGTPNYQKIDFHLPEISKVQSYLRGVGGRFVLVVSENVTRADDHLIVSYLYNRELPNGSLRTLKYIEFDEAKHDDALLQSMAMEQKVLVFDVTTGDLIPLKMEIARNTTQLFKSEHYVIWCAYCSERDNGQP